MSNTQKLHVLFKPQYLLCWDNHEFFIINGTSLNVCSTQKKNIYINMYIFNFGLQSNYK